MQQGKAITHGASNEAVRRAVFGSFFGTALEAYDFLLYGSAAGLVFNKLFFPSSDPLAGTLLAFATFAVGFIARPIGGIFIGNYGDKIGRKPMLLFTLGLMGVVTAVIGILPTYAQAGIFAPIFLTVLRFVQGIAYGGEWGGAVLVVVEHAPPNRRGFYGGFPNGGVPLGLVLASGALSLTLSATGDNFLNWGWRLPFLFSIVMIAIGLYVRTKILETPEFLALQQEGRGIPVVMGGAVFIGLYIFPLFWLVQTKDPALVTLGMTIALTAFGAVYGPVAAYFTEIFDTSVRYSGASLGYQIGAVFGGGLAPLIATALLASLVARSGRSAST
ncbi:MAG: MFS transporter [Xanthobacteraceae bacterium]